MKNDYFLTQLNYGLKGFDLTNFTNVEADIVKFMYADKENPKYVVDGISQAIDPTIDVYRNALLVGLDLWRNHLYSIIDSTFGHMNATKNITMRAGDDKTAIALVLLSVVSTYLKSNFPLNWQ